MGVHLLDNFLKTATSPKWTGEIVFQPMAPHCWGPPMPELSEDGGADGEECAGGGGSKSWKY